MSKNIPVRPHETQVALRIVEGTSITHKFGSNHTVGTSLVPITKGGVMQMPTANTSLEVVSSDNTNDKAGGAGALSITFEGLVESGGDWIDQTETIVLNGTTAVALTKDFIRMNRMFVASSGAYANPTTPSHNSTITLRVAGVGVTWMIIDAENGFGLGQSQQGVVSVASGKKLLIHSKKITVETGKPLTAFLFVRENAADVSTPYSGVMRTKQVEHGLEGPTLSNTKFPLGAFNGPCDFGFMGVLGTGTAEVGIDFEAEIVDLTEA